MDVDNLSNILGNLLVPNEGLIRESEESLSELCTSPDIIPALLEVIGSSINDQIRLLATIVLRQQLETHWNEFKEQDRNELIQRLFILLENENINLLKDNLAYSISKIPVFDVNSPIIKTSLEYIESRSVSKNHQSRISTYYLLNSLIETSGDILAIESGEFICTVLINSLKDESNSIKLKSILSCGQFAGNILNENLINNFEPIFPLILEYLQVCLEKDYNDELISSLEVLDYLTECPVRLIEKHLNDVLKFILEITESNSIDLEIRLRSLSFLIGVISKQRTFIPNDYIKPILKSSFQLALDLIKAEQGNNSSENSNSNLENYDEEIGGINLEGLTEEEVLLLKAPYQLINIISNNFDPNLVFEVSFEMIQIYNKIGNEQHKEVAVYSLSTIVDGCYEQMKSEIEMIMKMVIFAIESTDFRLQKVGYSCLSKFCITLQPEISELIEVLIPLFLTGMDHSNDIIKYKASCGFENFIENINGDLSDYMETIFNKVIDNLTNNEKEISIINQQRMLSIITSITASADKESFAPFYNRIMELLSKVLMITDQSMLQLRIKATECIAVSILVVGKKTFLLYFEDFFQNCLDGLELGNSELNEFIFLSFRNMAKVFKRDFSPYVPIVMEKLNSCFTSINSMFIFQPLKKQLKNLKNKQLKQNNNNNSNENDNNDDDDEEDEKIVYKRVIKPDLLNEKSSACLTLGYLAKYCVNSFIEYFEESTIFLFDLIKNFKSDLRKAGLSTLFNFLYHLNQRYPMEKENWETGFPSENIIPKIVKNFIQESMDIYFDLIKNEKKKSSIAKICKNIIKMINIFGPNSIEFCIDELMEFIIEILNEKTLCQKMEKEQDIYLLSNEELSNNNFHHDFILIDPVVDLIMEICKVLEKSFNPYLKQSILSLLRFNEKNRSLDDQLMAMGGIAMIIKYTGNLASPFFSDLLPLVFSNLQFDNNNSNIFISDSENTLKRNTLFLLGTIFENIPQNFQFENEIENSILLILQILDSSYSEVTKDNALSALSKIIVSVDINKLPPFEKLLPKFLQELPIKLDYEESKPVLNCLYHLFENSFSQMKIYTDRVFEILLSMIVQENDVYTQEDILLEIFEKIVLLFKQLSKKFPKKSKSIINEMPNEYQLMLKEIMSQY
ncbi:importin-4 [Anaeramoeba flamelloides]|uniref:Importin-4 n=1 Tax=Anaeramoeba flamelloides TaxID=1746091 RepID=A0AAV7YMH1_9EUKA|nr:importin-4 [Anaeramoeba flamelloides]